MKKIILLLLFPVFIKAQTPAENKTPDIKDAPAEKSTSDSETSDMSPRELIESYRQRVIKGESMSDMAKKYSQDPGSAAKGGLYANVAKGVMVPEFEAVAFRLKSGEISEVFETQYGYHFIQLISNHGERVDLRHILVKFK